MGLDRAQAEALAEGNSIAGIMQALLREADAATKSLQSAVIEGFEEGLAEAKRVILEMATNSVAELKLKHLDSIEAKLRAKCPSTY
eukprot:scaffold357542_cov46-Prasinocladus_malaysianus.AAC.1